MINTITSVTLSNKIDEGGFGTIYRAIANESLEVAVKQLLFKNGSIPCLMELSIMASLEHANLNDALSISVKNGMVEIVQFLADSDLMKTREKFHDDIPFEQKRSFINSICQAVNFLHENKIIHCDLKANNVLVYGHLTKVSDFSLSRPFGTYSSHIGTSTHRAPESWLRKDWNEKVDIWALGCTFFEIHYGYSLFPYQKPVKEDEDNTPAFLNAIYFYHNTVYRTSKFPLTKDVFVQPTIPLTLISPTPSKIDEFILRCLRFNPSERLAVSDILRSEFFRTYSKVPGKIISTRMIPLPDEAKILAEIETFFEEPSETVVKMMYQLYNRSLLVRLEKLLHLETCASITSKITKAAVCEFENDPDAIRLAEIKICTHLEFKLHTPPINIEILPRKISSGSPEKGEKSFTRRRS